MTRTERRRISCTPAAPAAARRYVGELLADAPAEVVSVAALMVSELTTNCVLHAHSGITVSVDRNDCDVRVDVADECGEPVVLRHPGPTEHTGRGLQIVQQLADEWGVQRYEDRPGKSVWFTVRLPPEARLTPPAPGW